MKEKIKRQLHKIGELAKVVWAKMKPFFGKVAEVSKVLFSKAKALLKIGASKAKALLKVGASKTKSFALATASSAKTNAWNFVSRTCEKPMFNPVQWWKSKSGVDKMLILFIGTILLFFAIYVPVSINIYLRNVIDIDYISGTFRGYDDTGNVYKTTSEIIGGTTPFLDFLSIFLYNNSLFFQDRNDVFMDWFSINDKVWRNDPYFGSDSSYPPLILKFAQIFMSMADYSVGGGLVRNSAEGQMSILIFYLICLIPTFLLFFAIVAKYKKPWYLAIFLALAFFVSTPFLFEYDRGNYVLVAIPFTLIFFLWYDSKHFILREFAYLALAVAVGIKIYPAAFALVLLKDKRFAGFVRTAMYSVVALVLPFAFFDSGFENIGGFLYWLNDFSGDKGTGISSVVYGVSYSYSPYNFFALIAGSLGGQYVDLGLVPTAKVFEAAGKYVTLFFILLIFFTGLTANRSWKVLLASALATLFVPSISFTYSGVMFVVPIIAFLFEEKKESVDWLYLVLFLLVLIPVDSPLLFEYNTIAFRWGASLMHVIQLLSYMAMLGLMTAESLIFYAKKFDQRKNIKQYN